MASATAGAPQPRNEEGRPTTERPSGIFVNHDIDLNSITSRRAQFLVNRFGLSEQRAELIAGLLFGEAAHG